MENRRVFSAIVAAAAVYFGATLIYQLIAPPPQPPEVPTEPENTFRHTSPTEIAGKTPERAATRPGETPDAVGDWAFRPGDDEEPILLGGREKDDLTALLDPRGAGLRTLQLTARTADGEFLHRAGPESEEPYTLVTPVDRLEGPPALSYLTREITVVTERNGERQTDIWPLDQLVWQVESAAPDRVVFSATLADETAAPQLRLYKQYKLVPDSPRMLVTLRLENLGTARLRTIIEQDAATGIRREHIQYNMRRLVWAIKGLREQIIELESAQRSELESPPGGEERKLSPAEPDVGFLWSAIANKFFAIYTRPLNPDNTYMPADWILRAEGTVSGGTVTEPEGDLLARITTTELTLAPGAAQDYAFEVYAGPKDPDVLKLVDPAYVSSTMLGYDAAQNTDIRCMCTLPGLPQFMTWLLRTIHFVVPNYGLAIIVLVIIIRSLLHPLAVFQQKSMYRMQDAMTRLQPKIQAIRDRYPNDRAMQNQEMMKLWAEENVNPAAGMVGFLPIVIQMPILVALWTALNTDIQLRNAPFAGWINDLSSPDALIRFAGDGLTIPVLSAIPLLGRMFTDISSFNLLPILMGVSMFLQQKYMPRPHMKARLEAAKNEPPKPRKPGDPMSMEDQMRQQRMIANTMSLLFPLMFYYMPSGLNLYWMATNVFGIGESLLISKQLKEERERGPAATPPPDKTKKPNFIARIFRHMAEQAEELQKQADKVSDYDPKKRPRHIPKGWDKKKPKK